jgi:hypothetical protein
MLTVFPTERIFILAGAGVSAESGIPTFRGMGDTGRRYSDFTLSVAPPAANQILCGGSPLRELKLETSFDKTTGDDTAALEDQFRFGAQKESPYLQHPACGRQPDGLAPRLS